MKNTHSGTCRPQPNQAGRRTTLTRGAGQGWWVVVLLTLLLITSFLDRTILSLLVKPIKIDLGISDQQFAVLYGAAFAIFFGLIGIPAARLVDRGSRKAIILCGVLTWVAATVLSGFAGGFAILLVLRMLLAVGEATLSPAAASLFGDLFPLRRRMIAQAIYAAGSQVGNHGSLAIGGLMIAGFASTTLFGLHGWRLIIVLAALPGILLAAVFALTVREPRRLARGAEENQVRTLRGFISFLTVNRRLYIGFLFGATGPSIVLFAYSAWMPEMISRAFDMPSSTIGVRLGTIGMFCGLAGTFIVPLITNRLINTMPGAPAVANLIAITTGCLTGVLMPLQASFSPVMVLYGLTIFLLTGAVNATLISLQLVAPRRALGTMHALGTFCITVAGLGIGPSAAAGLAALYGGPLALNHALSTLALLSIIPSALLLAMAVKPVAARIRQVLEQEPQEGDVAAAFAQSEAPFDVP